MEKRPLVSIVVPVYNAEKTLDRCLASIRAQTWREIEVLLVDDGSTDGSAALCRAWCEKDSRFRLIEKEKNSGVADSRNRAIAAAAGKYLQFADSDDWLCADATERMAEAAEKSGCELVVAGFYRAVLGSIPAWTRDSVPGFRRHVWAPDVIRYRGRWWLAYSCSTFGKRTSAIGLASSETLAVGAVWRDEGPLVCSREDRDNWNAIDPNFVIGDDGQPWLTFGSFWDGIQLVRLDSTMHVAAGEMPRTIARRKTTGRANPIEAPFIFRHDGWYYLFVSWDYCCRGMESTYCVAVGRSRSVAGPYLDRDGRDMLQGGGTLVFEGDKKDFEAAGHSAAYRFGAEDLFICHGYSIPLRGASILVQRKIEWTPDGWPTL